MEEVNLSRRGLGASGDAWGGGGHLGSTCLFLSPLSMSALPKHCCKSYQLSSESVRRLRKKTFKSRRWLKIGQFLFFLLTTNVIV